MNYYNEFDPNAAAWLRGLIEEKMIPPGEVDERSICDVQPNDLSGFTSWHFFAGIGGWPLALRRAGWPDNRPVGSGSCPCPPFSSAGKTKLCPECGGKPIPHPLKTGIFACVPCGHEWLADERHLYPELYRIMCGHRFPIFFGEQVAGGDGLIWLSGVRATLEGLGHGFGASDLCAAGEASPNLRQRLFWVAYAKDAYRRREQQPQGSWSGGGGFAGGSAIGGVGYTDRARSQGHDRDGNHGSESGRLDTESSGPTGPTGGLGGLGNADSDGREEGGETAPAARHGHPTDPTGFWSNSTPILCTDGKLRRIPTEPALFPLADGLSYKVARRGSIRPALLKGAGNAINVYCGSRFVKAVDDVLERRVG